MTLYLKAIKVCIKLTFLSVLFISCWQGETIEQNMEVKGTYIFKYPSGEIEFLIVNDDFTYSKDIYENYKEYQNRSIPKYTNEGRWEFVKGYEMTFYDWLMYNKHRYPDKVLENPYNTMMKNVFWVESTGKHKALISVYYETGYQFEKLD
jgi:hypothetical protein